MIYIFIYKWFYDQWSKVTPRRTVGAVASRAMVGRSADRPMFQRVIEEGRGVACVGLRAGGRPSKVVMLGLTVD